MTPELEKIISDIPSAQPSTTYHETRVVRLSDIKAAVNQAYALGQQNPGPTRYIHIRILGQYSKGHSFYESLMAKGIKIYAYPVNSEIQADISATDWQLIQQIPGWDTQLEEVK